MKQYTLVLLFLLLVDCLSSKCVRHPLQPKNSTQCLDKEIPCGIANCDWCHSGQCMECKQEFFLDLVAGECKACPRGCVLCSDANTCLQSRPDHYINSKGILKPCEEGCSSCSVDPLDKRRRSDLCISCLPGYGSHRGTSYFGSQGVLCLKCETDNCNSCDENVKVCANCLEGFTLSEGKCVQNDLPKCQNREPSGKCLDCPNGQKYSYSLSKCVKCPENCGECADPNECTYCMFGNHFNPRKRNCEPCQIKGCKQCLDAIDECEMCISGKYFDLKTRQCEDCHPTCALCTGGSEKECLTCATPTLKLQTTIYQAYPDEKLAQDIKQLAKLMRVQDPMRERPTWFGLNYRPFEDRICREKCLEEEDLMGTPGFMQLSICFAKNLCPNIEASYVETSVETPIETDL